MFFFSWQLRVLSRVLVAEPQAYVRNAFRDLFTLCELPRTRKQTTKSLKLDIYYAKRCFIQWPFNQYFFAEKKHKIVKSDWRASCRRIGNNVAHGTVSIMCVFACGLDSNSINEVWKDRRVHISLPKYFCPFQLCKQVFSCTVRLSTSGKTQAETATTTQGMETSRSSSEGAWRSLHARKWPRVLNQAFRQKILLQWRLLVSWHLHSERNLEFTGDGLDSRGRLW